ncbi:MAG: DMT family transporter [Spirochaetaceae bacterium]|nr:DMT family transporter [Spirochaetaceae bacterium]
MNKNTLAWLSGIGLILVTVIWGVAFVVVKNTLDAIPAVYLVALRFTVATLALCLVFAPRLKNLNKSTLLHGIGIGVFLFLAYTFQTIGCKYTTAGKNAFLTTIYVILVPFINWGLTKKRPDAFSVVAAVLSVVGIGLLSLRGDLSMNIGDVLTLVCGLGFALQIVFIARWSQEDDPILLTIIQIAVTAFFSWILAPFIDGKLPVAAIKNPEVIKGILFLALFSTMICFLLQNVCQKYLRPSTAALLMSFESVFGVLAGVIFLHELMDVKGIIGCCLMFLAVVISETKLSFITDKLHKKTENQEKNE